jgi:hypothetical protein
VHGLLHVVRTRNNCPWRSEQFAVMKGLNLHATIRGQLSGLDSHNRQFSNCPSDKDAVMAGEVAA